MADNDLRTIDKIAETLHDTWWKLKLGAGFTLGPRVTGLKWHPHLIPWSAKTEQEREQDRYQAVRVFLLFRENREANDETIGQWIEDAMEEFRKAAGNPVSRSPADGWDEVWAHNERLAKAQAIRVMLTNS